MKNMIHFEKEKYIYVIELIKGQQNNKCNKKQNEIKFKYKYYYLYSN